MIHIELECARCRAIFSGATVTSFACPGCGGALVYCSGAPRTANPKPAQPDAAMPVLQCSFTTPGHLVAQDPEPCGHADNVPGCSACHAWAAIRGTQRDAARAALVQIRGLALPYVTGTTREAWRAREVCRLVDEATDSRAPGTSEGTEREGAGPGLLNPTSPVPSSRDVEWERADVVAEIRRVAKAFEDERAVWLTLDQLAMRISGGEHVGAADRRAGEGSK